MWGDCGLWSLLSPRRVAGAVRSGALLGEDPTLREWEHWEDTDRWGEWGGANGHGRALCSWRTAAQDRDNIRSAPHMFMAHDISVYLDFTCTFRGGDGPTFLFSLIHCKSGILKNQIKSRKFKLKQLRMTYFHFPSLYPLYGSNSNNARSWCIPSRCSVWPSMLAKYLAWWYYLVIFVMLRASEDSKQRLPSCFFKHLYPHLVKKNPQNNQFSIISF